MCAFQRAGVEPVLPKVPAALLPGIKILRIPAVSSSQDHCQSEFFLRYRHQMDVVGHQTIAQDTDSSLTAVFSQQLQVDFAIGLTKKDRLSIRPALRHMVRYSRYYDSCDSWHLTRRVGSRYQISRFFAWDGSDRMRRLASTVRRR